MPPFPVCLTGLAAPGVLCGESRLPRAASRSYISVNRHRTGALRSARPRRGEFDVQVTVPEIAFGTNRKCAETPDGSAAHEELRAIGQTAA